MTKPSKRHLKHNNIALRFYANKKLHFRLGLKPFQTRANIRAAARTAAHAAIRPVTRPVRSAKVIRKPYPTFYMTRKQRKLLYRTHREVVTEIKKGLKSQIKYIDTTSDDPTIPS